MSRKSLILPACTSPGVGAKIEVALQNYFEKQGKGGGQEIKLGCPFELWQNKWTLSHAISDQNWQLQEAQVWLQVQPVCRNPPRRITKESWDVTTAHLPHASRQSKWSIKEPNFWKPSWNICKILCSGAAYLFILFTSETNHYIYIAFQLRGTEDLSRNAIVHGLTFLYINTEEILKWFFFLLRFENILFQLPVYICSLSESESFL